MFLKGTMLVTNFTNLCKHTDKWNKRQKLSINLGYCYSYRTGVPNLSLSTYPFSIPTDEHVPHSISTDKYIPLQNLKRWTGTPKLSYDKILCRDY